MNIKLFEEVGKMNLFLVIERQRCMSTENVNDFYNGITWRGVEAEIEADNQSISLQHDESSFVKS